MIDVVAPLVPVVKPQVAFFEQLGPPGLMALQQVILYARRRGLLVIVDAKRNDIGSTAAAYAEAYFGLAAPWPADALTVSPYLGDDSLSPFVDAACDNGGGIFVLVKTSNPGARAVSRFDGPPASRCINMSPNMSKSSPQPMHNRTMGNPLAMAASVLSSVPRIRRSSQNCAKRCRMLGSWFPDMGAREPRPPTSLPVSMPPAWARL